MQIYSTEAVQPKAPYDFNCFLGLCVCQKQISDDPVMEVLGGFAGSLMCCLATCPIGREHGTRETY